MPRTSQPPDWSIDETARGHVKTKAAEPASPRVDPKYIDFTGTAPQLREVPPLTPGTFVERLRLLSVRAADIRKLRAKMVKQP